MPSAPGARDDEAGERIPASNDMRVSRASRPTRPPGMSFGHDVLLALIMAVAMAATVFLYR